MTEKSSDKQEASQDAPELQPRERFGPTLAAARTAVGRSVEDVAETTRIQSAYIRALEDEDWSRVPEGVIGRGFVRLLSRELDLSPDKLIGLYKESRGEGNEKPSHAIPKSDWHIAFKNEGAQLSRYMLTAAAALIILGALSALGLWSYQRLTPKDDPSDAQESSSAPTPEKEPLAAALSGPSEPGEANPAAPAEAILPDVLDLKIQAVERVWVRVVSDGRGKREQMLDPGESKSFEAKNNFAVRLGNAGSVRIYWNGELLKVPGKPGQVLDLSLPKDLNDLTL